MHKFLIVGLGNIGPEYAGTRHNIGFDIADAFIKKHGGAFITERLATVAEIRWKGKILICIKPSTYMNVSGKAVKYWMDKENIAPENMLVIVDDLAISLTKIRLRPSGSAGGHNGLKSIQEYLQTDNYPKLRFGIGNDYPKGEQAAYVLATWNENEIPVIQLKIQKCIELIEDFVQTGIALTMNKFNNLQFNL